MANSKPSKRLEINKRLGKLFHFRASRTGGANISASPVRGVTLNSKHGVRVSKTFKGLTLGMQNFNSVVRGRWTLGDRLNVNLSKSGVSTSIKSSAGTLNLRNPKRSSATIAGVQVRGSQAATIAAVGLVFELLTQLIILALKIFHRLLLLAAWVVMVSWQLLQLLASLLVFALTDLPKQLKSKD